jgi:RNA polymerase sigma-70 factor (ECF subfamily)
VDAALEGALVVRAQAGDAGAYAALVRGRQQQAFRTAYLLSRNAADAEEVVQEAFVKAHRALHRFRHGAPFGPWLLAIVANEARNARRGAGRRERLVLRAGAMGGLPPASPEDLTVRDERRRAVLDALDRLPALHREVLACRYLLDLDEQETAAVLGCARGTVKSRVSRALARLRADLPDALADEEATRG